MIDIRDVIVFFDQLAPTWDRDMVRSEAVIARILDLAGVGPGLRILDVASGTGVLIGDYLSRGAASVTAVDISPEMVKIARSKFGNDDRVRILCGDAETQTFSPPFDRILVYNAFPHFARPEKLLEHLAAQLRPGGRLTVAHGMSRERINAHHSGGASSVSRGLPEAEDLAALFPPCLTVDRTVSDERMYLVSGVLSCRENM